MDLIHLSKCTSSLSPETKRPEGDADYSILSVAEINHGLCRISLLTLMGYISTNLHSGFYVCSVMYCIYRITFYEALPFEHHSLYIQHPLSDNLIIGFLQRSRPAPYSAEALLHRSQRP